MLASVMAWIPQYMGLNLLVFPFGQFCAGYQLSLMRQPCGEQDILQKLGVDPQPVPQITDQAAVKACN
jgi:hypothetical protein